MTPGILYVYDVQGQCNIFINQQFEAVLGCAWEEGRIPMMPTVMSDVHADDQPRVEWAREQCQSADDGAVIETEYRIRHASGEWRWLNNRNTVFVRNSESNPTQILGVAHDITDRKRLEHEVLEIAATEQRRIGQELHDGTGQELTGLCLLADSLADSLGDSDAGGAGSLISFKPCLAENSWLPWHRIFISPGRNRSHPFMLKGFVATMTPWLTGWACKFTATVGSAKVCSESWCKRTSR